MIFLHVILSSIWCFSEVIACPRAYKHIFSIEQTNNLFCFSYSDTILITPYDNVLYFNVNVVNAECYLMWFDGTDLVSNELLDGLIMLNPKHLIILDISTSIWYWYDFSGI